jgi:hypothetical protein
MGLGKNDPVDIAIYAHGGLTSQDGAGETAAKWILALYKKKIFPIFLMWETDLWSTLKGRLEDVLEGQPRPTGGLFDSVKSWWNERLEKLLATPGTAIWSEMKQNADAISNTTESGGMKLYKACQQSPYFADLSKVRLHLVGHSAGSILHSHVVDRLGRKGWKFESVNFMAPAVRVDLFEETVIPAIKNGKVKRFNQFHLRASRFSATAARCSIWCRSRSNKDGRRRYSAWRNISIAPLGRKIEERPYMVCPPTRSQKAPHMADSTTTR